MTSTGDAALIDRIVREYGLELLLLFGSRVDGQITAESDYDVGYVASGVLDLEQEARLIVDLAPLFRSENIDLVNLRRASPLLLYAATLKCRVLYARDDLIFPRWRAYAFKKYVETKPLREIAYAQLRKRVGLAD